MITLTYAATTLTLPEGLLWVDEHSWQKVEQRRQYTITGAMLIEAAAKQAGRPITLEGDDNHGWMLRSQLETLRAWAGYPAQSFTLSLQGDTYSVVFDHAGGAISARPVWDVSDPDVGDYYVVTLRFIEV